jgi:hypothetical protein
MNRYLKDTLKEITADEASDAEQRAEARKVHNNLRTYLKNNMEDINRTAEEQFVLRGKRDMAGAPFFWQDEGAALWVPMARIDTEYKDLWVSVTANRGHDGIGASSHLPGIKIMILNNVLMGSFNPKYVSTRLDPTRFVHEFIHYLDEKRTGLQGGSVKKFDSGDVKKYFNDPGEYNAYYQEALNTIENIISNRTFGERLIATEWSTLDKFTDYVFDLMEVDFVANLEPKYRKKVLKRLSRFYSEKISKI